MASSNEEKERYIPGLRQISEVQREDINWVWYPYIPAGKLSMLEGDPGLGKSWISCDIAARLSTGEPFPGSEEHRPPQNVLMLSAEDGLGETIRPRLEALGADLTRVFASDEHFILDAMGIKAMEATMSRAAAAMVFLDPIVAYMGGDIDMHKANEVRGLMASLHQNAKRTGAAIIAIRHLRKAGGKNAIYRGIGSIDFTAAARSALQVGITKGGRSFMEHIKHNLSPAGPTLGYKVEDGKFEWTGGMDWSAEVGSGEGEGHSVSTTPMLSAEQFLKDALSSGPLLHKEVFRLASMRGFSSSRVLKAKAGMGVHSRKQGKEWVWEMEPEEPSEEPKVEIDPAVLEEALAKIGRGNGG